ncbi:MAG: hypothetical protein CUR34_08345 [Sediminibacterium sp.]|nr:MAG: hypothetical protein CUR34_08345 [Sediminibacterium sp.] [Sediminibacterium sp. FEMGT703S]
MSKMRMIKQLQIFWLFYKSFAVASLFFTLCCISLFWKYEFSVFSGIFWFKFFTGMIIYYFVNDFRKKEYYFYYNLGISKRQLWVTTLGFDFSVFILSIILISNVK